MTPQRKTLDADLPIARPPRAPGPLIGIRLADGCDLKRVHADLGVVHLELGIPRIHDV